MLQTILPRISVKRIIACHALRSNLVATYANRTFTPPRRDIRAAEFSTTPRWSASEEASAQSVLQTQQKFARIFQEKPELQELVMNLKNTLEKEGTSYRSVVLLEVAQ